MNPEKNEQGSAHDPAAEMLKALEGAVRQGDADFFCEVVDNQDVLGRPDIAEFLYTKSTEAEDPQEKHIWRESLYLFSSSFDITECSPYEADKLNMILTLVADEHAKERMSIQVALSKLEKERESEVESDFDWEDDNFVVYISSTTVKAIENSVVFKEAVDILRGARDPRSESADASLSVEDQVVAARTVILGNVPKGDHRNTMLELLDKHIFDLAKQYAQGKIPSEKEPIDAAVSLVKAFASTELSERKMRICLDKYIYRKARDYRWGKEASNTSGYLAATSLIKSFASSYARQKGMLQALGIIQTN